MSRWQVGQATIHVVRRICKLTDDLVEAQAGAVEPSRVAVGAGEGPMGEGPLNMFFLAQP
ncbi:hypothetical protein OV450_8425 [Actinobacteria bacterium OV450]|nr:hypothetical protein OV450_8425 [Actinobacteria bacterium OV450]